MGQQYAGINNKYGKKGHLYDLSAKLLSQTKGSFMVICLENSDKFYFLHRIKCNLQTVSKDMGYLLTCKRIIVMNIVIFYIMCIILSYKRGVIREIIYIRETIT